MKKEIQKTDTPPFILHETCCAPNNAVTSVRKTELRSQLADALHSSMELDFKTDKSLKPLPTLLPNMGLCQEFGSSHLLADWGTGESW